MTTTAPVFRPDADYIDRQLDAELAATPVATEHRPTPMQVDVDDAAAEIGAIIRTARASVDEALSGVLYVTGPGHHDSALRELGPLLHEAAESLRAAGELLRTYTATT